MTWAGRKTIRNYRIDSEAKKKYNYSTDMSQVYVKITSWMCKMVLLTKKKSMSDSIYILIILFVKN